MLTAALLNTHLRDNLSFLYNAPSCRVYNSANISHATSGTEQSLTFNSERYDTDTMHSTATNTERITFTTAGKYLVTGHVVWAANATGVRSIHIRANGTTPLASHEQAAHSGENSMSISTVYSFAAGDYVELRVNQTSGGALNVLVGGNRTPEFAAQWLGS